MLRLSAPLSRALRLRHHGPENGEQTGRPYRSGRKENMDDLTSTKHNGSADEPAAGHAQSKPGATFAQIALIGIFLILLMAMLGYGRAVFLPITLALVIGTILAPLTSFAANYRIPHAGTAAILVLGTIALLSTGIVYLSDPVRAWIGRAPEIGANLREKLVIFDAPIEALNRVREALGAAPSQSKTIAFDLNTSLLQPALASLTPAVGQLLIFFGTLFFFLGHRNRLKESIIRFGSEREARLRVIRIWNAVEASLATYIATVAAINAGVGIIVGTACYFIGLPSPLVWGFLAFVLNFVPYIGPATMFVTLLGVGLVTFDSFYQALIAPLLFVGMSTIEGQFVTPTILGARLTLNPLFIFLSIAFWVWLWGPFGALLAVPLLIVIIVIVNQFAAKDEVKLPG
jgi:predicted PurR-regulated permease PerM